MDIFLSSIGLLILSPCLAVIAIAVKIDSDGPVIFKQKRLGLNGKEFDMYKFRTMVLNAENIGTGLFNYDNDPRVTRVGRFLRETSIDELPQFRTRIIISLILSLLSFIYINYPPK